MGAIIPIVLYPGVQAITNVPTAINNNVRISPERLP